MEGVYVGRRGDIWSRYLVLYLSESSLASLRGESPVLDMCKHTCMHNCLHTYVWPVFVSGCVCVGGWVCRVL